MLRNNLCLKVVYLSFRCSFLCDMIERRIKHRNKPNQWYFKEASGLQKLIEIILKIFSKKGKL